MKRMLSLFLILAVFCGGAVFAQDADALTVQADGITYSIQNGEATLIKGLFESGPVTVPAQVNGFPVTAIGAWAFRVTQAPSVTLPDSIRSVGAEAFLNSQLTSITFGSGLKEIDWSAFSMCRSLRRVDLPAGLVTLGSSAFSNCEALEEVTLPDGLTEVSDRTFQGCTALRHVTLPESVASIGMNAFSACSALTEITLPKGLKTLERGAFQGCATLSTAALPEGLKIIGSKAFSGCTSLTSLSIPSTVESMNKFSFERTPWYASLSGDFPTAGAGVLLEYRGGDKVVTVPDGTLTVGAGAFAENKTVEQVILPQSVRSIDQGAFSNCENLRGINIPPHAAVAGNALDKTPWLEENKDPFVIVGDGVLLRYNGTGTEAVVPDGVKTVCHGAFSCYDLDLARSRFNLPAWPLKKIVLPKSVQSVESMAFQYCENLTEVVIQSDVPDLNWVYFGSPLEYLYETGNQLDGGVIYSADRKSIVYVYPEVRSLQIPDGVERFYLNEKIALLPVHPQDCSALKSAYNLESVELPGSFTDPYAAFQLSRAPRLKEVRVSQDNPVYDSVDGVLYSRDHTKLHYYPAKRADAEYAVLDGTRSVCEGAFGSVFSLRQLTLPDGITLEGSCINFLQNTTLIIPGSAVFEDWAVHDILEIRGVAGSEVQVAAGMAGLPFTPIGYEGGPLPVHVSSEHIPYPGGTGILAACRIDGRDYLNLRSLAAVLAKTAYAFDVSWQEADGSILLTRGQEATQPNPATLQYGQFYSAYEVAEPSSSPMTLGGAAVSVPSYEIAGWNYVDAETFLPLLGLKWNRAHDNYAASISPADAQQR